MTPRVADWRERRGFLLQREERTKRCGQRRISRATAESYLGSFNTHFYLEAAMPVDATETPVLDTIAEITAASVENCKLPPRELMMARIAALIAVNAPPASYLLNAGTAADVGITLQDVEGILTSVAPMVGTPRVTAAVGNIARALGFAIASLDDDVAITDS